MASWMPLIRDTQRSRIALIQHDYDWEWIWCRQNEDGLIYFSALTAERDDKINAQQRQPARQVIYRQGRDNT
ncbi:hypothetical protein PABG_12586 [Paracoccidioides brasiliensis Pb03]|nr:hypothetical protein PABG_12586 [Paracoccidioides brasiliensis Pb03]